LNPSPLRLAVLVSHPIQYFIPLYQSLARESDLELVVVFRTRVGVDAYHDPGFSASIQWDIPLLDGYAHTFLSKKKVNEGLELSIFRELIRMRPDVLLVHGYNSGTNLVAAVFARILGAKVLLRGDTRMFPRHRRKRVMTLIKRILFRLFNGFVAIGSLNKQYYEAHGVEASRIFFAPFSVSEDAFRLGIQQKEVNRQEVRQRLGIPSNATVVLFASKFLPRKRAGDLLKAFNIVNVELADLWLIFAGSGPQESEIRSDACEAKVRNVRFLGFQNQSQLPSLFAASDIFVLPAAEEPWGLVINEAMSAGLPVIVSDEVGASPDLVEGKGAGIVYRCGDIEALAAAISKLARSPELRSEMSLSALRLIDGWGVEASVRGIVRAARAVAARK
jgi:glycosyltransferase involved in cell wall biosynthesis